MTTIESLPMVPEYKELQCDYSRKVFVGGLPGDVDEFDLRFAFERYGVLDLDWPHKAPSKASRHAQPPRGYVFVVYKQAASVEALVAACTELNGELYHSVASVGVENKKVHVRPWLLPDADFFVHSQLLCSVRNAVFVGGLPRPIKAYDLALSFEKTFGSVVYAGIDQDNEFGYPKGSGRVVFYDQGMAAKAIETHRILLTFGQLNKLVEIKPYVVDEVSCDNGCGALANYFCSHAHCMQYYCSSCWNQHHSQTFIEAAKHCKIDIKGGQQLVNK